MRSRLHAVARWCIAVSLVVMSIAGFASNQLLDEDAFASLITKSVDDPEVRKLLATKAIDIAIDTSNADVLLADALPEELSLVATPALELSKPAIAEAGATLLGIDAVESGLDAAARSVHRQTATAIIDDTERQVVINSLPVLLVVADEIAGDVGARVVVGLDLPESATSVDLGSNQSTLWVIVRAASYVAAIALLFGLVAIVTYFATAPTGYRLARSRRLGRTFVVSGVAIAVVGWFAQGVTSVGLEVALSPGEALSFGKLSIGGASSTGAASFAAVIFGPLLGAARRTIVFGLLIMAGTYVFGQGSVAVAARQGVKRRDAAPLVAEVQRKLPGLVRETQAAVLYTLVVLLLVWPQITLRVTLTLVGIAGFVLGWLAVSIGERAPAPSLRMLFGIEQIQPRGLTDRGPRASAHRRVLSVATVLAALVWPSYEGSGLLMLATLVSASFALLYRWELRPKRVDEANELVEAVDSSPRRKFVIAGLIAGAIAIFGLLGDNSNPASAAGLSLAGPATCNGHVELCDQRLDQVAFAGTHNSMSASELGWQLANHQRAIPAQLDGGIRALLIDVQYWPQGESIDALDLDPEAAAIAEQALAVDDAPEDGLWMCHKLCQLGGTPFVDFLADVRVFIETQPDEVLIIVIQDDAPAADIKAAIERAGIDEHAFAHTPGTPWPTLATMIERNQRMVLLAENQADTDGWYQLAFDGNVSETGFRYSVLEDFDCAESRGGNEGDFFMINHWVETGLPVPSEADRVNAIDVLRARSDECVADRGRTAGIVAVNFWERGDLLQFVDELNGVN